MRAGREVVGEMMPRVTSVIMVLSEIMFSYISSILVLDSIFETMS